MKYLGWIIALILAGVVAYLLFYKTVQAPQIPPSPAPQPSQSPTPAPAPQPSPSTSPQPLSAKVTITSPKAGATIGKSFSVTGSALGPWYFEASFPVQVRDKDDNVIGRVPAQAQGDWMTDKIVPFAATIQINGAYTGPATLILMKDNPSGLPQNDDSVSIPIVIK